MQSFNDVPPPPYSETDIYSQAGGHPTAGRPSVGHLSPLPSQHGDDAFSSSTGGDVIYTPPLTPQTSHSHPVEPSAPAAAYFDTRPAPDAVPAQLIEHTVTVTATSTPEDFPLAATLPSRDVTEQDWRTFLNFLLPDHTARKNEAVADRKLRAEGSDASTSGDAEAQISAIRSENGSTGQSRQDIERTVEEWNVWFFSPRGVHILLTPEADASRMPGAWDQSFDTNAAGPSNPRSIPPGLQPPTGTGPCPSPANARGFNFGGIRISDEGVSVGNSVVADRNGIRVGQFTADHSGIKYAGRNLLPPQFPPHRGGGWNHYGPMGGRYPGYGGPFGAHPRGHHHYPGPHGHGHHHAASVSSKDSSSDSSSSSESGDDGSSIGSLPDYDELNGQQFAVYSDTLKAWLERSGSHISKQDIRQLKTQLRAVRSQRSDLKPDERKACTVEIKGLIRELKKVIRQQKQERKELKRKEKQRKRAEKKERREKKRELKRARRDHARGRVGPVPPIPPIPPIPPVPAAPAAPAAAAVPIPPTPPAPPAPPAPHAVPMMDPMGFMGRCGPGGRGRGFGEGCAARGMGGGPWGNRQGGAGPWGQWGNGPLGAGGSRGGFPGAWPDTRGLEFSEGRLNGYNKAIEKLEKKIEQRETELTKLEIDLASGNHGRGWVAKRAEGKKVALEKEIEDIQSALENIRLQADEEYARIVEARENASY